MKTQDALTGFFKDCQKRGLSQVTITQYHSYLKHFGLEFLELPTTRKPIEDYLRQRGETPAHRGSIFKRLQAFYSYLEREEGINSPVPPKGKVGRPSKRNKRIPTLTNDNDSYLNDDKLVKGGHSVSKSISISTQTAVNWFLASRRASSKPLSPKTFEQYDYVFNRLIDQFPILPLDPEPLEEFFASIKGSSLTRWNFKKTAHAFYRFLEQRKKLPNPMEYITIGQPERKLRPKMELEQIKRLFALPLNFADKTLLCLIFDTGLRTGEICNLKPRDIMPGYIKVRGKTGETIIPIREETYEMLSQLIAMQPGEYVFQNSHGGPCCNKSIYYKVRCWLAQIGITEGKRGAHMLRHSFAPNYLLQGGTLQDLSQILGHRNLSTTAIYAEMVKEQLKTQHDKFSPLKALLGKADAWLCECKMCGQKVAIPVGKMPDTVCLKCGQKGNWYVLEYLSEKKSREAIDEPAR